MELFGRDLLANRYHNKGTAFSADERDHFRLTGLLPPSIEDLDTQLMRVRVEYDDKTTDLDRHIYLRLLQMRSTVLFYKFVIDNIAELLPIVYTPRLAWRVNSGRGSIDVSMACTFPSTISGGSVNSSRTPLPRSIT